MIKNTNFYMLIPHYEKSIASLKEKVIAYAATGNDTTVAQLNKDIPVTVRMIRYIDSDHVKKPPTCLYKYLN